MRSSKKAIAMTGLVLAVLVVISMFLSSWNPHVSITVRAGKAGSCDMLIAGASQAECAFVPAVLDEELGCTSFNLAVSSMTNDDKLLLLEKELARNPVQTVVLEISNNAMARPNKNDKADGSVLVYNQMETAREKLNFLLWHASFDNWLYLYAKDMTNGLNGIVSRSEDTERIENRGYIAWASQDCSLSRENAAKEHQSQIYSTDDYLDSTIEGLDQIITLCKSYDARIIVAVVPVADAYLWRYQGMDQFRQWLKAFCEERRIECYDFNLHRQRYQLFSDAVSYGNGETHMSDTGARTFSELFARTINAADRDTQFYESYEDMLKDSPYCES